ncbi:chalcone isomerase family protein [Aliidiomarina sanyensis]|uniref:Chalcone isomerase domain-containing protein n=1 Tax=Aliidiomarina sanyensis TaxID=1249555 RepID=A0A432WS45_9GAMM|nr:chalcone isomerase family protein [Aliidiomarina sanyensis]RUO36590.1 hypothetical protein CWE11_01905 [Aliidiomarina sanyensis]
MRPLKRISPFLVAGLLAFNVSVAHGSNASDACAESLTNGSGDTSLQEVGSTRLRVLLFRVYDAALYSPSGRYDDPEERLLRLNYLRNFSASQLVEQTRDEWERLGFDLDDQANAWLETLAQMWPDVERGQCLVAHARDEYGTSFYGSEGYLGTIESDTFSDQFLAIWLSENARYRSSRDELVGASR